MRAYRIWGCCLLLLAVGLIGLGAAFGAPAGGEMAFSSGEEENVNLFAPVQSPAPDDLSGFSIEVIRPEAPKAGRILIYHTHTYEAYEQAEERYVQTEKWRTADENHNMLKVGDELGRLLTALGFTVEHDRGEYEPPDLSSSYARSLEMLERRKASGEAYDLYIDLHRDAYTATQQGVNTLSIGGQDVAKLMLLIGKGEGQTSQGFDQRPDWEQNLALANRITQAVNQQAQGLCKGVRVKNGRYNQHVAPCCVLIEVGNNRNTLKQALASLPYLADAIRDALST